MAETTKTPPKKAVPKTPKPDDPVEKGFKSKKFVAYILASVMWKAVLFWMVYNWAGGLDQQMTILTTVIVSGFVDVGYIGSVAALDRYVRVARITTGRST